MAMGDPLCASRANTASVRHITTDATEELKIDISHATISDLKASERESKASCVEKISRYFRPQVFQDLRSILRHV